MPHSPLPSPFCLRIQTAMDVRGEPAAGKEFLAQLAQALAASDQDPERPDPVPALAELLVRGVPCGALAFQLHERATVLNYYRYERQPDWPYGTHASRRALVDEMWARAQSATNERATELGRGAVLLAAEGDFPFSAPTVRRLIDDPLFAERTGLAPAVVHQFREILLAEEQRTGDFVASIRLAKGPMDFLLGEGETIDEGQLAALLEQFEHLVVLAPHRADIQWRLANMLWRIVNLARSRRRPDVVAALQAAAGRWKSVLNEASASRWLSEGIAAPAPALRATGFRPARDSDNLRRP